MTNIRAQVRLQGASMLPEDVFVNTYHFVRLDSVSAAADALTPQIEALYDGINDRMFPAYVQRTVEVRFYDLATAEPRVPQTRTFTLPTATGTATLPFEVAMVVSFHGAPPVTARRRGRVYLGPLSAACVVVGSTTSPPIIDSAAVTDVASNFATFLDTDNGWSIRSTLPAENFVPVVAGWIDNEFDTQRARGHVSDTRTIFSAA